MHDIRILTGTRITPSKETVTALLGSDTAGLFEKLLPEIRLRIQPKAAICIKKRQNNSYFLYALLTIGGNIERRIEAFQKQNDMLSAATLNAMADSCLFALEEQLLPAIETICLEEGFGIAKRYEIPDDLPSEERTAAFDAVEADRTLGLSMTSGYMLHPVKSMTLVFALTDDVTQRHAAHACPSCSAPDCSMRKNGRLLLSVETAPGAPPTELSCHKGDALFTVLQTHHILFPADCGGRGTCGKCAVRVTKGWLPVTPEDTVRFTEEERADGMRLACRAILEQDLSISLPQRNQNSHTFAALGSETFQLLPEMISGAHNANEYGIAIDIGTTTLAFSLLSRKTGALLDTCTRSNAQRAYGADVISRIQAAERGKQDALRRCLQQDLADGIKTLVSRHLSSTDVLRHIVIAANTVLLHLLRGYSCAGFCRDPFTPVTLAPETLSYEALMQAPCARDIPPDITLLPGISAFVGADIVAGLYACDILNETQPTLFLDLGTNGEMALWTGERLFVASAAAGPALEGGGIRWGVGSIPGAISGVTLSGSTPKIKTIGDQPPLGICGTGVLEATAELLAARLIDSTGKLSEPYFKHGYPLAKTESGETILLLQQDIREIQMAKAAIRAGIELLLLHSGLHYGDIARVYLAGGFGYFLNRDTAAAVGLLPEALAAKTTAAGNTSLLGAIRYLAAQNPAPLLRIQTLAEEITLAKEANFHDLYIRHMNF